MSVKSNMGAEKDAAVLSGDESRLEEGQIIPVIDVEAERSYGTSSST
jgi:hypothetical protein